MQSRSGPMLRSAGPTRGIQAIVDELARDAAALRRCGSMQSTISCVGADRRVAVLALG
jgi:hypothetical protein